MSRLPRAVANVDPKPCAPETLNPFNAFNAFNSFNSFNAVTSRKPGLKLFGHGLGPVALAFTTTSSHSPAEDRTRGITGRCGP